MAATFLLFNFEYLLAMRKFLILVIAPIPCKHKKLRNACPIKTFNFVDKFPSVSPFLGLVI